MMIAASVVNSVIMVLAVSKPTLVTTSLMIKLGMRNR
jgi:hypothetical protein